MTGGLKARAVRVAATVAGLALLSALTRVPWRTPEAAGGDARLRLSWRVRGEIIQRCRRATQAELANVPAHMRQEMTCEGARVAPYLLTVLIDGRVAADARVAGSGEPGEGTLYLLQEFPLAPGEHHVRVTFVRGGDGDGTARGEGGEGGDRGDDATVAEAPVRAGGARGDHRHAVPPRLVLDTTLTIGARAITLVTYSAEAERLVVVGS
ncbi:MAG: hypothetical protein ACYC3Q_13710 [Gemmatimonadaceae bacterium]